MVHSLEWACALSFRVLSQEKYQMRYCIVLELYIFGGDKKVQATSTKQDFSSSSGFFPNFLLSTQVFLIWYTDCSPPLGVLKLLLLVWLNFFFVFVSSSDFFPVLSLRLCLLKPCFAIMLCMFTLVIQNISAKCSSKTFCDLVVILLLIWTSP